MTAAHIEPQTLQIYTNADGSNLCDWIGLGQEP
jgi:hypothetical protein